MLVNKVTWTLCSSSLSMQRVYRDKTIDSEAFLYDKHAYLNGQGGSSDGEASDGCTQHISSMLIINSRVRCKYKQI